MSQRGPRIPLVPLAEPIWESINATAVIIVARLGEGTPRALMICSAVSGEGKTTVASYLAMVLARKGHRVALVDGDLRRPRIHETLGLGRGPGLAELLQGMSAGISRAELAARAGKVDGILQRTSVDGLVVLTSGRVPEGSLPSLNPELISQLVSHLKRHHDFVIVDTPPIDWVADALFVAGSGSIDASIVVAAAERTDRRVVARVAGALASTGCPILGVLLNKFSDPPARACASHASLLEDWRAPERGKPTKVEA